MLPLGEEVRRDVLWEYLNTKFLLKDANQSHIYMFPGTVKHLHPEFDSALAILLKTDPFALVSHRLLCPPLIVKAKCQMVMLGDSLCSSKWAGQSTNHTYCCSA